MHRLQPVEPHSSLETEHHDVTLNKGSQFNECYMKPYITDGLAQTQE